MVRLHPHSFTKEKSHKKKKKKKKTARRRENMREGKASTHAPPLHFSVENNAYIYKLKMVGNMRFPLMILLVQNSKRYKMKLNGYSRLNNQTTLNCNFFFKKKKLKHPGPPFHFLYHLSSLFSSSSSQPNHVDETA
jgi:hypothetical protein